MPRVPQLWTVIAVPPAPQLPLLSKAKHRARHRMFGSQPGESVQRGVGWGSIMTTGIEKTALFSPLSFYEIELQPWKLISPLHFSEVILFLQESQNRALICYAVTFAGLGIRES